MTIKVGNETKGVPPKADVYLVRFMFSSKEEFSYWDGSGWSVGASNSLELMKFLDEKKKIKQQYRVMPKVKVEYFRTYENDGGLLVKLLKAAKQKLGF